MDKHWHLVAGDPPTVQSLRARGHSGFISLTRSSAPNSPLCAKSWGCGVRFCVCFFLFLRTLLRPVPVSIQFHRRVCPIVSSYSCVSVVLCELDILLAVFGSRMWSNEITGQEAIFSSWWGEVGLSGIVGVCCSTEIVDVWGDRGHLSTVMALMIEFV